MCAKYCKFCAFANSIFYSTEMYVSLLKLCIWIFSAIFWDIFPTVLGKTSFCYDCHLR